MKLEKLIKSPSIFIFVSTLIGYLVATMFEAGYLAFYHIDTGIMQINISQILGGALSLILALSISALIAGYYHDELKKINKKSKLHEFKKHILLFKTYLLTTFIICLFGYIATGSLKLVIILTFLYILFFIAYFIPILGRMYIKRINKTDAVLLSIKNINKRKKDNPPYITEKYILYLILCMAILLSIYGVGYMSAKPSPSNPLDKTSTNTYDLSITKLNGKDMILIRKYNNDLVLKEYDKTEKKLKEGYVLINLQTQEFQNKAVEVKSFK